MAYTVEQREALKEAIAAGVLMVRHGETSTTYRSLQEMERVLSLMNRELDAAEGAVATRVIRVIPIKDY